MVNHTLILKSTCRKRHTLLLWSKQVICQGWVQKGGYYISLTERSIPIFFLRREGAFPFSLLHWDAVSLELSHEGTHRPNGNRKAESEVQGSLWGCLYPWTCLLHETIMSIISLFPSTSYEWVSIAYNRQWSDNFSWKVRTWHTVSWDARDHNK